MIVIALRQPITHTAVHDTTPHVPLSVLFFYVHVSPAFYTFDLAAREHASASASFSILADWLRNPNPFFVIQGFATSSSHYVIYPPGLGRKELA